MSALRNIAEKLFSPRNIDSALMRNNGAAGTAPSNEENKMLELNTIMKKGAPQVKLGRDPDDAEYWLDRLLARAKEDGVFSERETITVARAAALLKRNPHNRPLSDNKVDEYARDMAGGRWVFNGESIILADTGELNDGQHRCAAVISSGRPIETVLVVGIPRARRFTTDMGAARTVGHFLGMNSVENANNIGTMGSILLSIEMGGSANLGGNAHPTKQQVLQYASRHGKELHAAFDAVEKKGVGKMGSASRFAVALVMFARKSKDHGAATAFINSTITGEGLTKRKPAYVCRERLMEERRRGSIRGDRFFEILIRCWNAHRKGALMSSVPVLGNWPPISE